VALWRRVGHSEVVETAGETVSAIPFNKCSSIMGGKKRTSHIAGVVTDVSHGDFEGKRGQVSNSMYANNYIQDANNNIIHESMMSMMRCDLRVIRTECDAELSC
jgi:hypothetical protein